MSSRPGGGETVRISTGERVTLTGRLWGSGPGVSGGHAAVVVIAPAMGIRQDFYTAFARYLAGRGWTALTFDYRGVGASRGDGSVRGLDDDLLTWARRDVRGVLRWVRQELDPGPVAYVGHSMGIPLLGLSGAAGDVGAVIAVAATHAYWRYWTGADRVRMWSYWHLLFPGITRLLGYFPGELLGLGADLPAGVALQWARWARHPDYLVDAAGRPLRQGFRRVAAPVRAYTSVTDPLAPRESVEALLAFFTRAPTEHRILRPDRRGVPPLGHLDYFRQGAADALWPEMASWMEDVMRGDGP